MYLLRKGAYREISHNHLKAHTIRNKVVSNVSAQKGEKSYDATNICSNFGSKWSSPSGGWRDYNIFLF